MQTSICAIVTTIAATIIGIGCAKTEPPGPANTAPQVAAPVAAVPKTAVPPPVAKSAGPASWQRKDLSTVRDSMGGEVFSGSMEVPPGAKFEDFRLQTPDIIPVGEIVVDGLRIGLMTDGTRSWTLNKYKTINKVAAGDIVKEEARPEGYRIIHRKKGTIVVTVQHGGFNCSAAGVADLAQAETAFTICSSYRPATMTGSTK